MSAATVETVLAVEDLTVELNGYEALTGVTFGVGRGRRLGVVGETGSGKTLTTRALTGLLGRIDANVVRGSVRFGELDLARADERAWRPIRGRRIGLVPQSSMSGLDPLMTVGKQLVETIKAIGPERTAGDPAVQARALLELVEIADAPRVLGLYPHELSGGMRQRVVIALALVGEPELVVADEPTTALDVTVQRSVLALLESLTRERGMSLVLVSHDLDVVRAVCDDVVIMYAGMSVEHGPTEAVLSAPAHPYTRALLAARPRAAMPGERLLAIAGAPPALGDRPAGCRFAPRCAFAQPRCGEGVPAVREIGAGHGAACVRAEEELR